MEIEKNKYFKLNDYCIIAFLDISCKGTKDYNYCIGYKSHQYLEENEYEIYGYAKDLLNALLNTVDMLTRLGTQTVSQETLKDLTIKDFVNFIADNEYSFPSPDIILPSDPKDDYGSRWSPNILTEGNEACIYLT